MIEPTKGRLQTLEHICSKQRTHSLSPRPLQEFLEGSEEYIDGDFGGCLEPAWILDCAWLANPAICWRRPLD